MHIKFYLIADTNFPPRTDCVCLHLGKLSDLFFSSLPMLVPWMMESSHPGFVHFPFLTLVFHSWGQRERRFKAETSFSQIVKNPSANAGNRRDAGWITGSGRSPGVGNGKALQYSCLENTMDKGALWTAVHGAAKSQAWLKWLSTHSCVME